MMHFGVEQNKQRDETRRDDSLHPQQQREKANANVLNEIQLSELFL